MIPAAPGTHRHTIGKDDWHEVRGALDNDVLTSLAVQPFIERLSIRDCPRITGGMAKTLLAHLPSTRWLWLWCDASRIALRHILATPGLETLDILRLCSPGRLTGFEHAHDLHTLRANCRLRVDDLHAIARCRSLRTLGLHYAAIDKSAIDALLALPHLQSLDLEGTAFNDTMARRVCRSPTLESLDIGATRITRRGLEHLVRMPNLKALDLWATDLSIDDLSLLKEAPTLEYVSIGGYAHHPMIDGDRVVDLLLSIPTLQKAWLDGVALSPEQERRLHEGVAGVRIS